MTVLSCQLYGPITDFMQDISSGQVFLFAGATRVTPEGWVLVQVTTTHLQPSRLVGEYLIHCFGNLTPHPEALSKIFLWTLVRHTMLLDETGEFILPRVPARSMAIPSVSVCGLLVACSVGKVCRPNWFGQPMARPLLPHAELRFTHWSLFVRWDSGPIWYRL